MVDPNKVEFKLELVLINKVLNYLGKQPYSEVFQVINDIGQTVQSQQIAAQLKQANKKK